MKYVNEKITSLLVAILLCFVTSLSANASTKGFLIDASVISYMLHNGATNIKVYMAIDEKGTPSYVVVPADGSFSTMSGQVYRQVGSGVCPPSCEFPPASLSGKGAFAAASTGADNISNYMRANESEANCVKISAATLNKVIGEYPYVKITFDSSVTVTGINDDGSAGRRSSYTESGNTSCVCGM
jgi:hypothetical protein